LSYAYNAILEKKKQMDFLATESETLVRLVDVARNKGEKVQTEMRQLKNTAVSLTKIFQEKGIILYDSDISNTPLKFDTCVGIDGSFQLVGGIGGVWYAPISVVRILFENKLSQPVVDVFWADIVEISEWKIRQNPETGTDSKSDSKSSEVYKPNYMATNYMLNYETKAIFNWGTRAEESYVLFDGPVVDPPVMSIGGLAYVEERCQAIEKCMEKSIVIGCAKRTRDRFFIDEFSKLISNESKQLERFHIDQYLIAYVFAQIRSSGYLGPLFTTYLDVSETNYLYKAYLNNGIRICSLFFQKGIMSQVLRIDIPFPANVTDARDVKEKVAVAVKAIDEWTLPGHDYPLPVFLAHDKCNIREGCADVLYDEILTNSRTVDPSNQAILSWLR